MVAGERKVIKITRRGKGFIDQQCFESVANPHEEFGLAEQIAAAYIWVQSELMMPNWDAWFTPETD